MLLIQKVSILIKIEILPIDCSKLDIAPVAVVTAVALGFKTFHGGIMCFAVFSCLICSLCFMDPVFGRVVERALVVIVP